MKEIIEELKKRCPGQRGFHVINYNGVTYVLRFEGNQLEVTFK